MRLMDELSGTENRIAVARGRYNEKVQAYNALRRRFPSNITAKIFSFEEWKYFEAPGVGTRGAQGRLLAEMSLRSLTAAACGAAAGLGLWASLGSIDRMQAPSGAVRVAMLPSVGTLALCVAAGALLFALLHARTVGIARRRRGGAPRRDGRESPSLRFRCWPAAPARAAVPAVGRRRVPGADAAGRTRQPARVGHARWRWPCGPSPSIAVRAHAAAGRVPRPADGTHAAAMTAGEALARRRRWTTTVLLASLLSSAALAQPVHAHAAASRAATSRTTW